MLSVDRIEGKYAVCEQEDGKFIKIPLMQLPDSVCEGDILEHMDGHYAINEKETKKRRAENAALFKKLLQK